LSTQTPNLDVLLTGNSQTDVLIRAAYDLGSQRTQDLLDMQRIDITTKMLQPLMRNQHMSMQVAFETLQIPRKERLTYQKILAVRAKQKNL